ncbi:DUF4349 domain-containing protein [Lentibacillus cibarius]|uniref:DUF4349 domain-containing protein n=1 Tax=Lentibacillus cibarius TaxID=2583219 RepID=A0A5S3QNV9_9BACI|nr:DUF4349 domain-containing protein [Lentibacillus cibarius]TMN22921.1 DUF4349 domain-containing protein [Lentibacillus cibarius]
MKKRLFMFIVITVSMLIAGCSNESGNNDSSADRASEEQAVDKNESFTTVDDASRGQKKAGTEQEKGNDSKDKAASKSKKTADADRKVIYHANLHIEVNNYEKAAADIRKQVNERGGYIVESSMQGGAEDGAASGQITARIPQKHFREFIQLVEDGSKKVVNSSISGQDVTEEYVDLKSRLESKRVVEKRLLSFMEQAKKTEDLLDISEDLAKVQEEIEQITGRMNYLQNKVDLATVTIRMEEKNVTITSEEDLNTWEKTKQQLMKSINFLLSAFSGLFVFIIGNLPVLIILGIIGAAVYWIIRRRWKNKREE